VPRQRSKSDVAAHAELLRYTSRRRRRRTSGPAARNERFPR
jgi:hypothetical protein